MKAVGGEKLAIFVARVCVDLGPATARDNWRGSNLAPAKQNRQFAKYKPRQNIPSCAVFTVYNTIEIPH